MADAIVACPSCGKKFRVAEDAEPGQFDCTNCGNAVPYGAAAAAPARALPARGGRRGGGGRPRRGGGGGGGGRARPAGRARGGRRGGGGRYDDEYDMPPEKSNATLWIVLAIVGVLVVGGGIVVAITMSGGDPAPLDTAGKKSDPENAPPYVPPVQQPTPGNSGGTQPNQPGSGNTGGAQPLNVSGGSSGIGDSSTPKPSETIQERGTDRPRPGGGGRAEPLGEGDSLYGQPAMRLRVLSMSRLLGAMEHLEETSPELRTEIDKLCALLVDFFAGRDAIDAVKRLAEIGKPAIPMMIASFGKAGDLASREGMTNACVVDDALRTMLGRPAKTTELKQMGQPNKNLIERTAKKWAVWWFEQGYKQTSFGAEEEGDDDDDE